MSTDLEARLRRRLSLPASSGDAEERGLRRALGALPAAERPRHRVRALTFALAATVAGMTIAAGALAAAGALHVSIGRTSKASPRATASTLVLPSGLNGIAAVIDGRLWLTTKGGTRIEGLPVASAELSPHALYVGAGIGHTLVVMAPNGRRAWAHATRGDVSAISWAPDGLLIAYVVHVGGGFQLRMIEGDGDHDRLIDPSVRAVRPSWRADALALAYVGAGGHAVVYDLAHRSRTVTGAADGVDVVAFAPKGKALAIASRHRVWVALGPRRPLLVSNEGGGAVTGIAWSAWSLAVGVDPVDGGAFVRFVGRDGARRLTRGLGTGGPVLAVAGSGGAVAVAVGGGRPKLRILTLTRRGTLSSERVLAGLPAGPNVSYFVMR
jgi:hypothetical protein